MDVPIEGLSWLFPFDTVWHFSIVYLVMELLRQQDTARILEA